MIVLSFGLFIHFTEESVIEAVDVNGTRELERLPDNFDGRFGCVLLLKVFHQGLSRPFNINVQRNGICMRRTDSNVLSFLKSV